MRNNFIFVEDTVESRVYLESRVWLFVKYAILFYAFPFPFFSLLNIFIFLFTEFCSVIIVFTFSLSGLADRIRKNHVPLPYIERGAARLISRFVEYIIVARLLAPGSHFLSIAYWVILSVAYRLVLFIAYCIVFVIAYRLVFLVAYRPVFVSRIVTLQLINFSDHRVSYRSYDLQLWTSPLGIRRSQRLPRHKAVELIWFFARTHVIPSQEINIKINIKTHGKNNYGWINDMIKQVLVEINKI